MPHHIKVASLGLKWREREYYIALALAMGWIGIQALPRVARPDTVSPLMWALLVTTVAALATTPWGLAGVLLGALTIPLHPAITTAIAVPILALVIRARVRLGIRRRKFSMAFYDKMLEVAPPGTELARFGVYAVHSDAWTQDGNSVVALFTNIGPSGYILLAPRVRDVAGSHDTSRARRLARGLAAHECQHWLDWRAGPSFVPVTRYQEARLRSIAEERADAAQLAEVSYEEFASALGGSAVQPSPSAWYKARENPAVIEVLLPLAKKVGGRKGEERMRVGLGTALRARCELREASSAFAQALAALRDSGDSDTEAECLLELGRLHLVAYEPGMAEQSVKMSARLFRQLGKQSYEGCSLLLQGRAVLAAGNELGALRCLEEATAAYHFAGDVVGEAFSSVWMARAYSGLGRYSEAKVALEQWGPELFRTGEISAASRTELTDTGKRLAERHLALGWPDFLTFLACTCAEVQSGMGDVDRALALYQAARECGEELLPLDEGVFTEVLTGLSWAALAQGEVKSAAAAIDSAQKALGLLPLEVPLLPAYYTSSRGRAVLLSKVRSAQSGVCQARSEMSDALSHSSEAVHWLESLQNLPLDTAVLYQHSVVLRACGRAEDATWYLKKAWAEVMRRAALIDEPTTRESYLNAVRLHSSIQNALSEAGSE